LRLAVEKAQAVFARHAAQDITNDPLIVLGADTTVACDGHILAKPDDAADAMRMLRRLSGRTHQVMTGVAAVTRAGGESGVETTEVTFSEISEAELAAYCATDEPLDKAGAYGIQGYAARWIPRIDGCYFNVMGLPIARTAKLIEAALADCDRCS
jgi:septum formation protein